MSVIEREYTYTKELARMATRRFLRRHFRGVLIIVPAIAILGLVGLVAGFANTFTFLASALPFLFIAVWYSYIKRAEKVATRLRDPKITLLADENGLTLRSIDHTSTISWSRIEEVWKFSDVWLIFPYGVGSAYTALPTSVLSDGAIEFVSAKLAEGGTKIVGFRRNARPA